MRQAWKTGLYGLLSLILIASIAGCKGGSSNSGAAPTNDAALSVNTSGKLAVYFLDIGQGDSALVVFPDGKTMLIDAGPRKAGDKLVQDLHQLGVTKLDWIVGSHPHEDHIGGFIDVLKAIPATQAIDSGFNYNSSVQLSYLKALKDAGAKLKVVKAGESFEPTPETKVSVLAPVRILRGTDSDPNNNSVIMRLDYGKVRFLFTGDMEEDQRATLYTNGSDLRADILKVAHHGSHNGTDNTFLTRVQPKVAIISCEKGNSYGHPHKEALAALRQANVTLYRIDQQGTIRVTSDGNSFEVTPQNSNAVRSSDTPANSSGNTPMMDSGSFIGNPDSKVLHSSTCSRLPSKENRIEFNSLNEALKQGYRKHKACLGN